MMDRDIWKLEESLVVVEKTSHPRVKELLPGLM